ncbi:MAG: hypothetical protein LUG93_02160 [Lachnospiraceae bacterium]|nr:hypothetical protein [Lachnospiraceae bacterium]
MKIVKLMLVAVLLVTAVRHFDLVQDSRGTVTIVLDGMALSAAEAEAICQNEAEQDEPLSVCFFGEQTVQVTCEENGKNASVTLILAVGNPTLLAEGGTALNWMEDGCLIDQDTASSIFGTSRTSGQYLQISGAAYQVCGTFESELPVVIRNAAASDENALTQAVLKASSSDNDNLSGKAEQFLTRHSLSGTVVSIDHLTVFVGDLLLLVPLALLGRLVGTIMKEKDSRSCRKEDRSAQGGAVARKKRRMNGHTEDGIPTGNQAKGAASPEKSFAKGAASPGKSFAKGAASPGKSLSEETENSYAENLIRIGRMGLLFASAFATFWLAFHYFKIPSDMIPTRWSDFSFWDTWLEEQKKNILLLLTTPLGKIQTQLLWNCLLSLSGTLAAAFLAFL